ncbi:MAG: transglutaminase family protein [Deltaproteobacteria bacterium]|nr:transglutaminase family protein [Deltaproteobacteria bacterium]
MQPRAPSETFRDLALRLRRDEDVSLEEVALTLDADQNPGIDPALSRALLDGLAERAGSRLCSLRDPGGRVLTLVDFLHREERFRGNTEDYNDPGNSYLHQVLERRTGIPITLCIVTIEVGRRLGIPIHGVSFPRHFLARATGNVDLIIDAFAGRTLTDDDCAARLEQAVGPDAVFDRRNLRAATPREVLLRMLGNLKHVHIASQRYSQAAECCERMLLTAPELLGELRDRGILHERLELYGAAIADYEKFLDRAGAEPSADTIRARRDALRQRVH